MAEQKGKSSFMTKEKRKRYLSDTKRIDKLIGLRDTTIYVSNYGYRHMSNEFLRICQARNLVIEVFTL